MIFLYYFILSATLLPGIDRLRELYTKGKKENINHRVSGLIAVVVAAGLWLVVYGLHYSWLLILYPFACLACRGLIYDGMLNLLNRLPFDHKSGTTSAKTDKKLKNVPFWWQRVGYAGLMLIVLIINHFL